LKNIALFDKNNNYAILLAGILTLVIGVGVARFAFTSLLPSMLENHLSISYAGILASNNFFGYMLGAIASVFIIDIQRKVKYFRLGIIISLLSSISLGLSTNDTLWLFSRFIAGFGSALVLIIGGSLVMYKINFENKTKAMGIHFSGIGFAIVISELFSKYLLLENTWNDTWLYLSLMAFILSFYSVYILSFNNIKDNSTSVKFDFSIFSKYIIFLIIAYFTEGVGFVIQGTFLPDIINSIDGLSNQGNNVWLAVGIAGIPSSILWMRLAHKYGSINMIIIAMLLQIIGLLIPIFTNNIYFNLLSGVLYGSTFIGLVALFMTLAGNIIKHNPAILMGAMTAAYAVGQVTAPLYSIYFIEYFGNYDTTLYLTSFIIFVGIVFLLLIKDEKLKAL